MTDRVGVGELVEMERVAENAVAAFKSEARLDCADIPLFDEATDAFDDAFTPEVCLALVRALRIYEEENGKLRGVLSAIESLANDGRRTANLPVICRTANEVLFETSRSRQALLTKKGEGSQHLTGEKENGDG